MDSLHLVRCAYCHAPGDATTRECAGCGTLLHGECWSLAQVCPTLGCARPVPRPRKKPAARRLRWERIVLVLTVFVLAGVVFTMYRQQQVEDVSYTATHSYVDTTDSHSAAVPNGTKELPAIVSCPICELELADDPDRDQKTSRIDIYRAVRYRDGFTRTTHFACSFEHRQQLILLRRSERP